MEKKEPKRNRKNGGLPAGVTNRDQKSSFVDPGQKGALLSRLGGPGWETGTKGVSQPGQIPRSVVVVSNKI